MTALFSVAAPQPARAGPAINQFEVKDLNVDVGRWEFQSQNAYSWRQPMRQFVELAPGDFVYDENTVVQQRYALELELGVSKRVRSRIGIEFEKERVDDPISVPERDRLDSLEIEELAIEGVLVLVPVGDSGIGVGLLAEYQYSLERSEPDSLVFGPIVEVATGHWLLLLNPALVRFFGGQDRDDKLDFSYAIQLSYAAADTWRLAMEAYGTIDRLGDSGSRDPETRIFGDHDLHRLGPIAYYRREFGDGETETELSLGVGFFAGLNDHTPDATLKLSIEYEF